MMNQKRSLNLNPPVDAQRIGVDVSQLPIGPIMAPPDDADFVGDDFVESLKRQLFGDPPPPPPESSDESYTNSTISQNGQQMRRGPQSACAEWG